jgi:hypothetical protein
VATYARADAVDLVVSAESDDRSAAEAAVEATLANLRDKVGQFVFAEGDETWPDALAKRLNGRSLGIVEIGSAGQLQSLLGNADYLLFGELVRSDADVTRAATHLSQYAERVREVTGADVGLALYARESKGDTHVRVAIATSANTYEEKRVAFLGGEDGQRRAALAACSVLWSWLGEA